MICLSLVKPQGSLEALSLHEKQPQQERTVKGVDGQERFESIKWGNKIYMISTFGRVKRMPSKYRRREIFLKPSRGRYLRVTFDSYGRRKTFLVHRLVATAFISNPLNKPVVNHKDGVNYNNFVDNLEWSTSRENNIHSINVLGRNRNTEKQRKSAVAVCKMKRILTIEEAGEIRKRYYPKVVTAKMLGKEYGLSIGAVYHILQNRSYKS